MYLPGPGGVPAWYSPPRGQTHTCKHITLPQTSFAGGNERKDSKKPAPSKQMLVVTEIVTLLSISDLDAKKSTDYSSKLVTEMVSMTQFIENDFCSPQFGVNQILIIVW